MNKELRWRQRFENLERAYRQFNEAVSRSENLSKLEQEGLIQRFEYTFELSWKTIKDFLEAQEVTVMFPREVIKAAFRYEIIEDGDAWIDMLEKRNMMAHTYDEVQFEKAIEMITKSYAGAIGQVYRYFEERR